MLRMQADTLGRRRAAFHPQAREILAGQMIQDPLDHAQRHSGFASFRWRGKSQSLHCLRWWVFDGGDDLDRAATIRTGLHINLENPLEALRPSHRRALLGQCAIFGLGWLCGLRTPAPAPRRDPSPVRTVRCKYPVEAGQIQARRRDESRQPSDEIQRFEDHVGSAVGRWVRFARSARSALRETISAFRRGTVFSGCGRCRRVPSGTGAFLKRAGRAGGEGNDQASSGRSLELFSGMVLITVTDSRT